MNWKRFAAALAAMTLCLSALAGCTGSTAPTNSAAPSPANSTAPSQADAQETDGPADLLAAIQAKGEITIALEGTWAPWGYHDEDNKLVGYDVEIGQAIADHLGVKANFVEGEWAGLLAGLEGGRYDIMINGMDVDAERQEKYDFSTPYAYNRTVVIVRADDDSIQAMEDLNGKTTANTLNSTYANVAESYGANVTPVDDFIQTIQLLNTRRIDATLNAEASYYDYLGQHPDAPIKIACIDPETTQVAIPVRKGEETAALLAEVDAALEEMRQDGRLSDLAVKYFGTDLSKSE